MDSAARKGPSVAPQQRKPLMRAMTQVVRLVPQATGRMSDSHPRSQRITVY
jgi:hypothetical protein